MVCILAQVAIVPNSQYFLRSALTYYRWEVLEVKPIRRVPTGQAKVSIVPQPPKHIAHPLTIRVVYLQDPRLMSHGE
jgi:hypothetical protein